MAMRHVFDNLILHLLLNGLRLIGFSQLCTHNWISFLLPNCLYYRNFNGECLKTIKSSGRKGYYFRYVSAIMAETKGDIIGDIIVDTILIIGKYPILIITGCHGMTKEEMQNLSIARSSWEDEKEAMIPLCGQRRCLCQISVIEHSEGGGDCTDDP